MVGLLSSHAEISLKVLIISSSKKPSRKRNLQHKRNKLDLRCIHTYLMVRMLMKRNLSSWLPRPSSARRGLWGGHRAWAQRDLAAGEEMSAMRMALEAWERRKHNLRAWEHRWGRAPLGSTLQAPRCGFWRGWKPAGCSKPKNSTQHAGRAPENLGPAATKNSKRLQPSLAFKLISRRPL